MCFGMQKLQGTQHKVAEQSLYSTLGCRNWNLSLEPDLSNASTCRQDAPAPNFNVAISNCTWQSCSEHRTRSTNTRPNNVEIGGSGVASTAKVGKTAWMASSNSVWHKRLPLRASSGWFWGGMTWNGCGHATAHGTTTRKLKARKTSLQSVTQRWRKKPRTLAPWSLEAFFFCSNALIALARSLCKCLLAVLIIASGANTVKGYLVRCARIDDRWYHSMTVKETATNQTRKHKHQKAKTNKPHLEAWKRQQIAAA